MVSEHSTMHSLRSKNGGFIALISILIISMVLLFAVFAIGQRGIASRFLLLDLERKTQSEQLANACIQIATIDIANNAGHIAASDKEYNVGSSKCTIHSVQPNFPSAGRSTIEVFAIVPGPTEGATTNLQVVIDSTNGNIMSWQELTNLP